MMKKKTLIILIASIIAVVALLAFVIYENLSLGKSGKVEYSEKMFASDDSSTVKRIFIADMAGNTVLLQRGEKGWQLEDSTPATPEMVNSLLATLMNLRVDRPVPAKQVQNMNRVMAASAIKVEVYEDAPSFTLFGHPFFVKEQKVKTIYIGPATQENTGNYAMLEGMEEKPCIIYLPGFRGIVSPRFSALKQDWVSHQLLSTKPTRIQTLEVFDCRNNDQSFTIQKVDDRHYDLYNHEGAKVAQYDTARVFNLLAEFRDKKYQSIAIGLDRDQMQNILQNNLFKVITLTDTQGQTIKLNCYFMDDEYDYYDNETGDKLTDIEHLYNQDRFYATLNDDKEKLYILQYFVFGRMVQTELSHLAR